MKLFLRYLALPLCLALSACAVLNKNELAEIRAKHVSEQVMHKLERGEALLPSDVVDLTKHGISNERIAHYIRRTGIAAPMREAEAARLRGAGVSSTIVNLLENESDKLEADRRALSQQPIDPPPPPPPIIPPPPVPPQPAW